MCLVQFNDFYLPFQMMKFECSLAHWKELVNPNEGLVQLNDVLLDLVELHWELWHSNRLCEILSY